MGNYHPHGDSAIYDTLVRMAQDFSMRYPLVDGQGNFGSVDDDPAAAMRYTEARLARLAMEMLARPRHGHGRLRAELRRPHAGAARPAGALPEPARQRLVRHRRRHGDEHPAAQPARGRSTASIAYIDDPTITVEGLMKHIKGPDFPTGGTILGRQGIRDAYETGRGRVRVQARGAHRAARRRARRRSSSPSCPTRSRRAARAA